jgi:hypothetical protein
VLQHKVATTTGTAGALQHKVATPTAGALQHKVATPAVGALQHWHKELQQPGPGTLQHSLRSDASGPAAGRLIEAARSLLGLTGTTNQFPFP